ncbi:MAG: GntR family transcriptional regulator, partial [Pyrinomonadaceae bacterium]
MIKWFVDKDSKVPLYLQLEVLIRYYISTGAIQVDQRLPTVKDLAKKLEINSETIRKAYKELEKEGLIETKRRRGTFATGRRRLQKQTSHPPGAESQPLGSVKNLFTRLLHKGVPLEEVRIIVDQALNEVSSEASRQRLV